MWSGGLLGVWALTVVQMVVVHCCCHVGCLLPIAGGVLIVLVIVHCCCHVGCLPSIVGGDGEKNASPSEKPMLMRRGADKKEKKNRTGGQQAGYR
jgi:hypothetical protein